MPETYIVRFKVLALECTSMPNGQQYTITYRRGETYRSTPCYIAEDGVVNFSPMPEGAAILHFKSGGPRFLPKWITFRVEEYTRGRPRKPVGETQLDCSEVLGLRSITASATRRVTFDMYGTPAQMVVAVLLYPEGHAALSFGNLLQSSSASSSPPVGTAGKARQQQQQQQNLRGNGEIKHMARGEAMTLLISLEAMLERRRAESAAGKSDESPLQRRLAELEERRRALTGVEGMATTVVTQRVEDVVSAQFLALSRMCRANYVGEVAAYLRQVAVTSGVPLTYDISEDAIADTESARERLQRINARIDTLMQQVRKLEEEQEALGRMQGRADVTNELCAILTKVETLQSQIQLLIRSRVSLEDVVRGKGIGSTPIGCEVKEIRDRLRTLTSEEQELRERIRRMTAVAAKHVLKWARGKNPPIEDVRTDLSTLFAQAPAMPATVQKEVNAEQRRQIMEALANVAEKPTTQARSGTSSDAEGEAKPPREDLFGATGLPSMNDFDGQERKAKSGETSAKPAEKHADPFMAGLRSDMFESSPQHEQRKGEDKPKLPVFDFGATEDGDGEAADTKGYAVGLFASGTQENALASSGAPAIQVVSIDDDPMYDFRPPPDVANTKPITFEIDDSSFHQAVAEFGAVKPPMYSFGSESQPADGAKGSGPAALPTYNFGSDSATKNSGSGSAAGLPLYNFGS
ncbi:hypothetical protein DQ04_01331120 [Trypanosoma grayi]|uniref:hypothetical protein n=1 Tax=Trypanosoma grayi TaxID=71804 RepID=UPI0004F471EF|nr:hypothetical protein DQ04_01331120 [Trypanosoma grayi]KEG12925.1 hypothetical protein DQ04_01331120 [Trypanosoma grayi]